MTESAAKRMDELEHEITIRNEQIAELRELNTKLHEDLAYGRMLLYATEAECNAETKRCAKIASEFTLSPVVGKAIAALILGRGE